MKHYCIFEFNRNDKSSLFVMDLLDYSSADDMCQSLNNFRGKSCSDVYFFIRCLEESEFLDLMSI